MCACATVHIPYIICSEIYNRFYHWSSLHVSPCLYAAMCECHTWSYLDVFRWWLISSRFRWFFSCKAACSFALWRRNKRNKREFNALNYDTSSSSLQRLLCLTASCMHATQLHLNNYYTSDRWKTQVSADPSIHLYACVWGGAKLSSKMLSGGQKPTAAYCHPPFGMWH